MKKRVGIGLLFALIPFMIFSCKSKQPPMAMHDLLPWCISAFDSLQRTPAQRIAMVKELGFTKYAYGWRNENLAEAALEINLARDNDLEIVAVWLWLNANRDSLGQLSTGNQRMLDIVQETGLKTTLWVGFNHNFFDGLTQDECITRAAEMIAFIQSKLEGLNCNIALYNHKGWFGDPRNQLDVIEALGDESLTLVFNFHHLHAYIDDYPEILNRAFPYLSAVNLNGMSTKGSKIMTIGNGEHELTMIELLLQKGYNGPWGILDHIKSEDSKIVLERNIAGLRDLNLLQ